MGTLNQDLAGIKAIEDKINNNKVASFAYTETAYQDPLQYADGVMTYDVDNPQNIPVGTPEALRVNETVLAKGWRSQASSISRMLMNHFLGRCSYNLNQVNDQLGNLLSTLISHLGRANGLATLDANGRIPYSQLPESAMEFKGTWNAQTNTPQLVNGSGTNGDFYVCNVAGTANFGAGDITFLVNDRVIYNGSIWSKLSAGDIRSVDGFTPDASTGNVTLKPAFTAESAPANNLASGSTLPTLFARIAGWINNFIVHRNNTSNPHSVTKSQVGLGNVVNTGDSADTSEEGTTKFTTGGARNLLTSIAPYFDEGTTYWRGQLVTYKNRLYRCSVPFLLPHRGPWINDDFTPISMNEALTSMYVPTTREINGHSLTGDVDITKSDIDLGSVQNKGMTDFPFEEAIFGGDKYLTSYGLFVALRNHIKSRSFALDCKLNYIFTTGLTHIVDVEKIVYTSPGVSFYLVATDTGVFKCSDAHGQNVIAEMKYLDVSMVGVNKIVNAHYEGLIYVCTQHGIFRTDNYGDSWVRALPEGNNSNCTDLKVVPRELINSNCFGIAVAIVNGYLYYTDNKFSAYHKFTNYATFSSFAILDRSHAIACEGDYGYGACFIIDLTNGNNWACDPTPRSIGDSYPYCVGTACMKMSKKQGGSTPINRLFTIPLAGLSNDNTAKIKCGGNTWMALSSSGSLYRLVGRIWSGTNINDILSTVDGFEYCRQRGCWVAWKNNGEFAISKNGDEWSMLDYIYSDTIPSQIFGVKDLRDSQYRLSTLKVFADTGIFEIISEDYYDGIYE